MTADRRLLVGSSVLVLVSALGCSDPEVPTGTVSGEVIMKGEPLPAAEILFVKAGGEGIAYAAVLADDEGKYVFDEPLLVGEYEVSVGPLRSGPPAPDELTQGAKSPKSAIPIPEKYWNPGSSGLVAKVEPGENVVNLNLE